MSEKASKQILIGVAIGVITAVGCKVLIDWFWSQPEPALIAKVKFGPVAMPPMLLKRLETLQANVEKDAKAIGKAEGELLTAIYSEAFTSKISNAETTADKEVAKKQVRKTLAEVLAGKEDVFRDCRTIAPSGFKFPENGGHEFYELLYLTEQFRGYWEVEVINNGTAQAEGISMDLPDARYAVVTHASGVSDEATSPASILLGSLGPKESVKITAWTNDEPYVYKADKIVIRHSKGLAALDVLAPTFAFWSKLDSIIRFAWLPLFCLALFLIYAIYVLLNIRKCVKGGVSDMLKDIEIAEQSKESQEKSLAESKPISKRRSKKDTT